MKMPDVGMYARAVPLLLRHPSILAMPLLAAAVDWGLTEISPFFTDALGGAGAGIFALIAQLVYGFAFGIAVIQASQAWRGRRASFDEAWEEGSHKWGGIVLAAMGFYFLVFAAGYVGAMFGGMLGFFLELAAAFFLIYTIPAAAIGGMPGSLAIQASVRAVRQDVFGTALLAIAFILLWVAVPQLVLYIPFTSVTVESLAIAGARALVLGYLAFPFAKQYDDIAFTRTW